MKKYLFTIALSSIFYACNTDCDNLPNNATRQDINNHLTTELVTAEMNGQQVILERIDGQLIFQGDIVIGEDELLKSHTRGAGILPSSPQKWSDNKVYYVIDSSIPDATAIKAALKDWQQNSNLTFFPRANQRNYIKFTQSTVNNSHIGMKGGEQIINLINSNSKGVIMHEIGHALGLWHEHCRKDRDHYIIINWNNIVPAKRFNFDIYDSGMDYGPFDFNSIMLYDSYVTDPKFIYDPKIPVMTKLDGTPFWAQNTISDGDRYAIQTLYSPVKIYGNANWNPVPADYDGDGKADLSIKTNDGYWLIDYAYNGFGKWDDVLFYYGDGIPVPADYDGDGKIDLSNKRNDGYWEIDYASNGIGKWDDVIYNYGDAIPVPADYDGDGKIDFSNKRNDGYWEIDYTSNGRGKWDAVLYHYGGSDATPVPADYDGDGKADLSIKDTGGGWYTDYSANGFGKWDAILYHYGGKDAIPVPADYDGDGKADLSIKDSGGGWYIDYSANGFGKWDAVLYHYGDKNAIPVPADYDGDGRADLSIKDSSGTWFIDYSSDGFNGWNWRSSN